MACMPQFWDWLENRRSKNNEMSRRMWKAVETKARKIRVEKAKEKMKREQTEEERKERMMEVKKVAKE